MRRLLRELTALNWIRNKSKMSKADKGRPMSFDSEPRIALDFNFTAENERGNCGCALGS